MPFHIEINSPVNRVRVLNLDESRLREEVLEPWVAGLPFELGDREWARRESRLTILEGPTLEHDDQEEGWEGAQRAAEDVTRPQLEAAEASAPGRTAVTIEADSVGAALEELRGEGAAPRQIPWSAAVKRIENRDPEVAAVILVLRRARLDPPKLS